MSVYFMHRAQHPKLPDENPRNAHMYLQVHKFSNLNTVAAQA